MKSPIRKLSQIQFNKTYLLVYIDEMGFESESTETGLFITQHLYTLLVTEFPELLNLVGEIDLVSEEFSKRFLEILTPVMEDRICELGYLVFELS